MNIRYERETKKTFNQAIDSISKSLKDRSFGVLWQLNFKEKLSEHGIDFPNNFMILEVCNPQKASQVLSANLEVGYFLPCKIAVYEREGRVFIGTVKPGHLIGLMGFEDLGDVADEVENILIEAIDAAI